MPTTKLKKETCNQERPITTIPIAQTEVYNRISDTASYFQPLPPPNIYNIFKRAVNNVPEIQTLAIHLLLSSQKLDKNNLNKTIVFCHLYLLKFQPTYWDERKTNMPGFDEHVLWFYLFY